MVDKGEALTRRRPLFAAPVATSAKPPSASGLRAPLNRLVIACVGCGTLATVVASAWQAGNGASRTPDFAAQTLIFGLEVDVAAGAAALAVGLWLANRLERRADAATATVADALDDLAADPNPRRLKPLDAAGDHARLATGYNNALAALVRRERQLALQAMAQGEKTRLIELAMLRQDIGAPLASIKDLVRGLAQEAALSDAAQRRRRTALALGRFGESVLATLQDLTRRTSASPTGFDVHASPVDLAEVMDDVCALLWAEAEAAGVDLAVYIDPKTPLQIQADPVRLRQVIGGLAAAALAATREGGVLIEVEPASPTSIRISIHDTGPALGRPIVGAEPGGDSVQSDVGGGDPDGTLPVRMAIYREIVKAMGGAFAAPARRDRGATVAFRLPAKVSEVTTPWAGAAPSRTPLSVAPLSVAPPSVAPPSVAPMSAAPPRVLLAVRGPCTRRALSRYLDRAGLVHSVYSGGAPPADARLLIGDTAGLPALARADIQVVRLAGPDDLVAPGSDPVASATLNLPLNRAELEKLLRKFNAGQPLLAPVQFNPPPEQPQTARSLARNSPTDLTDDERALLEDLDRAAERDEFSLVYQPQVERDGERILGVEALLRWNHPIRGLVSPSVFVPLAEKVGRIADVTSWVVDRVLAETQYLTGLEVSFNASALEFGDKGFVDRLLAAVADTGYDARRLQVEITETAILQHEKPVLESMERLHAAGIGVALDDFGAGYSSLSHLRRYPFDKLKIDREFITDCSRDMESATVVHAVVSIGRALGMKVIAEGVETETQRNFLRIAGVYAMQGYLFGKPVPIDDLAPLIGAARAQAWG
jgi:EAL domain-containing protein (putative c-di-GMP-specific phosphodiesterase class I)/signal transduction histidine kinase